MMASEFVDAWPVLAIAFICVLCIDKKKMNRCCDDRIDDDASANSICLTHFENAAVHRKDNVSIRCVRGANRTKIAQKRITNAECYSM